MKLRFSNRQDFQITFEANDLQSLTEQAASAARSFRIATERRVHRGEIHKTVSWFETGELGIYDENHNVWFKPGSIKQMDSKSLGKLSYFTPQQVELPWTEADNLDDMLNKPLRLLANGRDVQPEQVWQMIVDTYQWGMALNTQIMTLGDDLDRLTKEESDEP